jgi:ABC-type hemin transport system ATPase subunit
MRLNPQPPHRSINLATPDFLFIVGTLAGGRSGAQQCLDARSGQLFSLAFIHGPNGFGKTTVLRLVHALLTGELQVLKTVDFKELEISYSDAHSVIEP